MCQLSTNQKKQMSAIRELIGEWAKMRHRIKEFIIYFSHVNKRIWAPKIKWCTDS